MAVTEPQGGLELEQFAGVVVAVEVGVPLEDVLEQEQIEPAKWPAAERAWREAIADAAELHVEYMKKRRQAEDALARSVDPLEEDVSAWVGLLGALAVADEPDSVVQTLGITMTDVGRLGRHWKRRAEKDAKLATQMTELAGKAGAPAKVTVGPVVLKPFPWSPKSAVSKDSSAQPNRAESQTNKELEGLPPVAASLDLFAALAAVLEVVPDDRRTAISLLGMSDQQHREVNAVWRARIASDPAIHAEFSVMLADYRSAFRRLLAGARPVLG